MAECNPDVLNYIVPPGSENLLLSLIVDNLICSFFCKPNPPLLLNHCPVGSTGKNTINETEKKQDRGPWASGTLRYDV